MASVRMIAVPLLALLAACQAEKAPQTAKQAGGEILEGSISDAMLPLDRVRSQPPLAPKGEGGGSGDSKAAPAPKARAPRQSEASEPDPAPAPAPEPAPEPAEAE